MSNQLIMSTIEDIYKAKKNIADWQSVLSTLEATLKELMGDQEELLDPDTNDTLVTWKWQVGARRVDMDRLKKLYPDVADDCMVQGEPMRKFLLKV